jgi:hypothetical protein
MIETTFDYKKAIPTEYKGVVYRSKSEAMFARYLELSSGDRVHIHYEWEDLILPCGYVPDFTSIAITAELTDRCPPDLSFNVIEYKPCMPTDTYVCNLIDRFNKIQEILKDGFRGSAINCRVTSLLYVGSPFTEKEDRKVLAPSHVNGSGEIQYHHLSAPKTGWPVEGETDYTVSMWDLLNYRFDLPHTD